MLAPSLASIDFKAVALSLGMALGLAASLPGLWKLSRVSLSWFEWLSLAWAAALLLAWLASPYRQAGLLALASFVPAMAAGLVAHRHRPGTQARGGMLAAWMVGLLLVAAWAIGQRFGLVLVGDYARGQSAIRSVGSYGNASFLAAFLIVALPLAWPAFRSGRRALALAAASAALLALAFAQARSAVLALLGMALLAMAAGSQKKRWAGLLLITVLVALALPLQAWMRPTLRWELWAASFQLWLKAPLLGFGPGSFVPAMQEQLPRALELKLQAANQFAEHPHNLVLGWLSQGGLVLLAVAMAWVGFALRQAWNQKESEWIQGLGLGLAGLLAQNVFDRNLSLAGSAFFLWVYAGWLTPPLGAGRLRISAKFLALLAAIVAAWLAFRATGELRLWRQLKAQDNFAYSEAAAGPAREEALRRELQRDPSRPAVWISLGETLARQQRYAEAAQAYERVLALRPDSMTAVMNLGNCYFMLNRWPEARARFEKAINLDPGHADAHFNLGYVLFYENKMKAALVSLDRALQLDSAHAGARKLKQQILAP